MIYQHYIKLSTLEYPRHEGDIRLEYPEITEDQTGETFPCPETYAPVESSPPPTYDESLYTLVGAMPLFENGKWIQQWGTVEKSGEERAQYQTYKQEAEAQMRLMEDREHKELLAREAAEAEAAVAVIKSSQT